MSPRVFAAVFAAVLATFVILAGIIHLQLFQHLYAGQPEIFRPEGTLAYGGLVAALAYFIAALGIASIVAFAYDGEGLKDGIRAGSAAAIIFTGFNLYVFIIFPVSTSLAAAWIGTDFIAVVAAGAAGGWVAERMGA